MCLSCLANQYCRTQGPELDETVNNFLALCRVHFNPIKLSQQGANRPVQFQLDFCLAVKVFGVFTSSRY